MKTLKTSLLALALVVSTVVSATNVKKENSEISLTKEISSLLEDPNFYVNDDIIVNVDIMLNKAHEIVVLTVDTSNEEVESFIKNRLNYRSISDLYAGQPKQLNVPVRFTSKK